MRFKDWTKISVLMALVLGGCATGMRDPDEGRVYMRRSTLQLCLWPFVHGCKGIGASFEPQLPSSSITEWLKEHRPLARQIHDGLAIAIDEYASAEKSRNVFDAAVAGHGVLPLLVNVENKGTRYFNLRRDRVQAFLNGEPLRPLDGYEAAQQAAARDYVWRALASTVLTGPLAIYFSPAFLALSASHTKSVNQKIERHFESLELADALLKPNESTAGFVYFKIPELSPTLEDLIIEITVEVDDPEDETGAVQVYRLPLPPFELSRQ